MRLSPYYPRIRTDIHVPIGRARHPGALADEARSVMCSEPKLWVLRHMAQFTAQGGHETVSDKPTSEQTTTEESTNDTQSTSVAAERNPHSMSSRLAFVSAGWAGSGSLAALCLLFSLIWVAVGAATQFPHWWELVVTVGVPLLSLQMLIVVQHTASHANQATQLKLDELIRVSEGATNHLMTVEDSSRSDLQRIHAEFSDQRLGETESVEDESV